MGITIYGASDDLIEIEGDIREEFCPSEEDNLLALSSGVLLRIWYSEYGVWRIQHIAGEGVSITEAPEDDDDNYSDVAVVESSVIKWIVLGNKCACSKKY
jgi:hypothetical protein